MNPYILTEACVERLYREYQQHGKLIIACDLDDTVFDFHDKGFTYEKIWDTLRKCQDLNFYIVAFTGVNPDKYESVVKHFADNGIKITGINQNPFPLPFGNHGKMYFNILLDDRAGLGQSLEILETVLHKIDMKKFYSEAVRE